METINFHLRYFGNNRHRYLAFNSFTPAPAMWVKIDKTERTTP